MLWNPDEVGSPWSLRQESFTFGDVFLRKSSINHSSVRDFIICIYDQIWYVFIYVYLFIYTYIYISFLKWFIYAKVPLISRQQITTYTEGTQNAIFLGPFPPRKPPPRWPVVMCNHWNYLRSRQLQRHLEVHDMIHLLSLDGFFSDFFRKGKGKTIISHPKKHTKKKRWSESLERFIRLR